jgi:hypothetical protein
MWTKDIWNTRFKQDEVRKALDQSAVSGVLTVEEIDTVIADLIEIRNPLRQNLMRQGGSGENWNVTRRTDRGAGAFVNDTETLSDDNATYTRTAFPYKTPAFQGKVTRRAQAVGRTFGDLLMEEIENGMQVIKDLEEDTLVNGSISGNAKQFDGLKVLLDAQAGQTLDLSGAELTLDAMDEGIDLVLGNADMILTSKRTARELNALLQTKQRFNETVEVEGGFRLKSYDGIPIFTSNFVSITESTNQSRVYILDSSEVFVGELTPLSFVNLAKTSSQFDAFEIFEDIVLVYKNLVKAAQIKAIAPPT